MDSLGETSGEASPPLSSPALPSPALVIANSFDSYVETPEWDLAENPRGELSLHLQHAACLNSNDDAAKGGVASAACPGTSMGWTPQPPQLFVQPGTGMVFRPFPVGWMPDAKEFAPVAMSCVPVFAAETPAQAQAAVPLGFVLVPVSGHQPNEGFAAAQAIARVPMFSQTQSPEAQQQNHQEARSQASAFPPARSPGPAVEDVLEAMESKSSTPTTRRRIVGKCEPQMLWGARKRPRGEGGGSAAAGSSSGSGGRAVADVPTAGGQHEKRPPPEASEEEWERRHAKRQSAVACVKTSTEYVAFHGTRPSGASDVGVPAPKTPDPMDRNISKRTWEDKVRQWRTDLRQRGPADGQDAELSME